MAILQKQWEDSSTAATAAIACSIALQDAARALKKDSQQATQSTQAEDEDEDENKDEDKDKDEDEDEDKKRLDRSSSDDEVLNEDEDDTEMDDFVGLIME